jgi:Protein of unknown function (DUF732)
LLPLTGLTVVIGMAVPVHAYTSDEEFLASIQAAGISYPDPQRVIAAGKWVCQKAGEGQRMLDLVKSVETQNPGLSEDKAAKFAAIAATVYCPNALAAIGGTVGDPR